MKTLMRIAAFVAIGALALGGCGQTGPLYLPGNPSDIRQAPPEQQQNEDEDEDESNGSDPR